MRPLNLRASSVVAGGSYDEEQRTLTLELTWGTYVYTGIDPDTVTALETSPSPGSFVHRHLKGRGIKA